MLEQQHCSLLFSSADMYWPELHDLFQMTTHNTSSEERRQNNIPHIVDWFFTQRLESFVKHWLYEMLDAKCHWFRYEYQGRGRINLFFRLERNSEMSLPFRKLSSFQSLISRQQLQKSNFK